MKVAFSLPFSHPDGTAPTMAEIRSIAGSIERAGFGGIWIGDSIGRGRIFPDPLQWPVATTSVYLGIAAYIVPLRNPVELAQRLLTTHLLTGARFLFGVGTGSNEIDFRVVGQKWDRRFQRLSDRLSVIRRLCRGEAQENADLHPWVNAIPGPPILVEAWISKLWIHRAATESDGWLASGGGPGGTLFKDKQAGIRSFRDLGGKRAIVATVRVGLSDDLPREPLTDGTRFTLRCHLADARERVNAAKDLGFCDVMLRKEVPSEAEVSGVARLLELRPAR